MQTIGERLEEARKKKGISIREAAEATKIRGDYLSKFEGNQFDIGLTEIYTRGFLRGYANFLKIPSERILHDYAALGRGDVKPRQPNRQVYGTMDISVATAAESGARATPSAEAPAAEPARAQPRYPRGASSLPEGMDPAVVFKYLKWAGAGLLLLLVIWIATSLFSRSGPTEKADRTSGGSRTTVLPADQMITLIASDTVNVTVVKRNPDGSDGELLFKGVLMRGQRQIVAKPGPIFVTASALENLAIEYKGQPLKIPYTGNKKVQLE